MSHVIGLPDYIVRKSKERISATMRNAGWEWLHRRVTVNLTPTNLGKERSALDPTIAVGILATSGQISVFCGRHFIIGR